MAASICTPSMHTNNLAVPMSMSMSCSKGIQEISSCKSKSKGFNQTRANLSSVRTGFGVALPGSRSAGKRGVATMVIPFQRGSAWQQPPPDLPSYFFNERIVYLGMPLLPSVSELLHASFIYLATEDPDKPIYMYINSTGITKDGYKFGYESEAFGVHDHMQIVKERTPIYTLCIGNAWGEAALLLAAGSYGYRAALPSTTIMIKEPVALKQGQATDLDLARRELRYHKNTLVSMLARHTGHSTSEIEQDIRQPKYFSPEEAVEYGLIDKVLHVKEKKKDDVKPNKFLATGGL